MMDGCASTGVVYCQRGRVHTSACPVGEMSGQLGNRWPRGVQDHALFVLVHMGFWVCCEGQPEIGEKGGPEVAECFEASTELTVQRRPAHRRRQLENV